ERLADRLAGGLRAAQRRLPGGLAPIQHRTLDAYDAWKAGRGVTLDAVDEPAPEEEPAEPALVVAPAPPPEPAPVVAPPPEPPPEPRRAAPGATTLTGWYSVRCLFRHHDPSLFEERITLWPADSLDAAVTRAEA